MDAVKEKERGKRYRAARRDVIVKRSIEWQRNNKDKQREIRRRHRLKNAHKVLAANTERYVRKQQAVPKWAQLEREQIEGVYKRARTLTEQTGIPHHVDHIIPLNGKNVCGLHCFSNLQVLTYTQNLKKGNRASDI